MLEYSVGTRLQGLLFFEYRVSKKKLQVENIVATGKYCLHFSYFSFMKLFESHPDIGDQVLCSPVETISQCNEDIIKAQQTILEREEYKAQMEKIGCYSIKRNVRARFYSLPVCPELHRSIFPKNVDLGCFLKVTGER